MVIEEIVISAQHEERRKNVEGTQMGTVELPMENIKKMPAIFGETDILKTLQLLPGVLSSGEGKDVYKRQDFFQSNGDRFQISAGKTTIGGKTFSYDK